MMHLLIEKCTMKLWKTNPFPGLLCLLSVKHIFLSSTLLPGNKDASFTLAHLAWYSSQISAYLFSAVYC